MKGVILALLLYRYRSDSSGKTNQVRQNILVCVGQAGCLGFILQR